VGGVATCRATEKAVIVATKSGRGAAEEGNPSGKRLIVGCSDEIINRYNVLNGMPCAFFYSHRIGLWYLNIQRMEGRIIKPTAQTAQLHDTYFCERCKMN